MGGRSEGSGLMVLPAGFFVLFLKKEKKKKEVSAINNKNPQVTFVQPGEWPLDLMIRWLAGLLCGFRAKS